MLYERIRNEQQRLQKKIEQMESELRNFPDGKLICCHLGKIDQPSYAKSVFAKLQTFASYGLYPTINLITTYETKDAPLNTEIVEKIIEHYFL